MDVSIARGMALIRSALHGGGLETRTTAGLETGATGFRGARAMDVSIAREMALIRSALHGGGQETPATAGRETGATGSRGARGEGESAYRG